MRLLLVDVGDPFGEQVLDKYSLWDISKSPTQIAEWTNNSGICISNDESLVGHVHTPGKEGSERSIDLRSSRTGAIESTVHLPALGPDQTTWLAAIYRSPANELRLLETCYELSGTGAFLQTFVWDGNSGKLCYDHPGNLVIGQVDPWMLLRNSDHVSLVEVVQGQTLWQIPRDRHVRRLSCRTGQVIEMVVADSPTALFIASSTLTGEISIRNIESGTIERTVASPLIWKLRDGIVVALIALWCLAWTACSLVAHFRQTSPSRNEFVAYLFFLVTVGSICYLRIACSGVIDSLDRPSKAVLAGMVMGTGAAVVQWMYFGMGKFWKRCLLGITLALLLIYLTDDILCFPSRQEAPAYDSLVQGWIVALVLGLSGLLCQALVFVWRLLKRLSTNHRSSTSHTKWSLIDLLTLTFLIALPLATYKLFKPNVMTILSMESPPISVYVALLIPLMTGAIQLAFKRWYFLGFPVLLSVGGFLTYLILSRVDSDPVGNVMFFATAIFHFCCTATFFGFAMLGRRTSAEPAESKDPSFST